MSDGKRSLAVKLGLFALLVAGVVLGLRAAGVDLFQLTPDRVRTFVISFGVWAPLVYLLAYAQPLVPLPLSIMTIAAGLAFGPLWGTLGALAASTLRACAQFGVARLLGREVVAKLLHGRAAAFDQQLGDNAFQAVFLIRTIPNVPFDMQNYGLGFSKIRFLPYALGTLLGLVPTCAAFVYLGYSLTDPTQIWKLLLAILVIIGLTVATRLWKKKHAST